MTSDLVLSSSLNKVSHHLSASTPRCSISGDGCFSNAVSLRLASFSSKSAKDYSEINRLHTQKLWALKQPQKSRQLNHIDNNRITMACTLFG